MVAKIDTVKFSETETLFENQSTVILPCEKVINVVSTNADAVTDIV